MPFDYEELLVSALLLAGVVGIYYALKLHYIFAFSLVQKTSLSQDKKEKIEKIKKYVLYLLKLLLVVGLLGVVAFEYLTLSSGESLKSWLLMQWQKIPEGFWLHLLWTLLRIAVLIMLMRYLLRLVYGYLDRRKSLTLDTRHYNKEAVELFYLRLHNTIKYTVVLGIVYRIVHFFPFLLEVSYIFLMALILFFVSATLVTIREFIRMLHTRK